MVATFNLWWPKVPHLYKVSLEDVTLFFLITFLPSISVIPCDREQGSQ
jgi:hypothetical protein